MKNFKYPLAIEGTKDQLLDLATKLEELGYKNDSEMGAYWHDGVQFLLTTWLRNGQIGFNQTANNYQIVSASTPDLVLALAAMVDDDNPYVGEYIVWDEDDLFPTGTLSKIIGIAPTESFYVDNYKDKNPYGTVSFGVTIKATKEEIINHFTPKTFPFGIGLSFTQQNHPTMEKKIIGYKLKDECKQYESAACRITGNELLCKQSALNPSYHFAIGSLMETKIKESGVLDLWFEPVYREEEYKVGDTVITNGYHDEYDGKPLEILEINGNGFCTFNKKNGWNFHIGRIVRRATREEIEASQTKVITLRCEGGTFDIEVSKKGIYYKLEDKLLKHTDLKLIDFTVKVGGYEFTPSHIDSGCKKQVPIEDWRKVLKAYDEIRQAE